MARRPKLTQEMVDEAIRLKADGLSNGDIICALGIHESTFYRWIGDPKNRLQRALSEGLKKEESAFKRTLLTTIRSAALARNQYWTAAAWLLERKYPDEFGKAERKGDDAKADAAHRTGSAWWPSRCSRRCRWTGSARGVPMVDASSLVIPAFHDVLGDVMAHGHTHYWLHGGRGSTKSSFISVCIVLLLLAHPEANAVIVRRFSNTLRDSVFQQVTWAIAELGIERWFRARISPMEITYLPTGQRIVFRGADDPLKLKGMKFTRGYCAVTWFEELDQFDGIDAVRSILNSLRRGGEDFWIFYSYNPPRTLWSWVNREKLERERRSDTLVRQSSYLDVIESHPEWLGGPFVEEAEYLREVDEQAWRSEYLGEVTGTGGSVFNNVVSVRLSDAACRGFSRTRCGVDWGWFPDPWRFVRCGWEPGERRLTIFGELSANRKTPTETAALVAGALTYADAPGEDAYLHDELIWCDDTPDGKQSMAVWRREAGRRVRPARKSNMPRLSYEWLAGLREIVIDPERAPLAYEEFRLKEYDRDRDGTWLDDIPDGNDHSIDAVRYAMMDDVLRG